METKQLNNKNIKTNQLNHTDNESKSLDNVFIESNQSQNDNIETKELDNDNTETKELDNDNTETKELDNDNIETKELQNNNTETKELDNDNIETKEESNIETTYIEFDQLSRNFSFCDPSKIYKIHCVVFGSSSMYIEGQLELDEIKQNYYNTFMYNKYYHYMKYAMKIVDNEWVFNTFDYICPVISNIMYNISSNSDTNIEEENIKNINAHFETECYKKVFEMFENIENLHKVSNLKFYKGFIEFENNNIFVFFDISELYNFIKPEYKSILMNEFLSENKTAYNLPINSIICDFFIKNESVHKLKNKNKQYIPLPKALYLCELTGDQFFNSIKNNKFEKVKYYYNYNKLVPGFYFSELIQYDKGLNENINLLKCAVFIVNSLDLGIDIEDLIREDGDHNYLLNAQTICYNDSNIKMYAIKNISHFSVL
jgi:hypothetical protein